MKPQHLFLTGLIALSLTACCTPGRPYEDNKVALITRGVTSEPELVGWFGPPTTRAMAPDGSKTLAWKFSPGCTRSAGKLDVRLDPDGKVTTYTASATN